MRRKSLQGRLCIIFLLSFMLAVAYLSMAGPRRLHLRWISSRFKPVGPFDDCLNLNGGLVKSIENLPKMIKAMASSELAKCRHAATLFDTLFDMEQLSGQIVLPKPFKQRMQASLGEELTNQLQNNQPILKVFHKILLEESIYSLLRGKRPAALPKISELDFTLQEIESSRQKCDFCHHKYLNYSASDEAGRFESEHSFTVANSFKYDKWHMLAFSREHDPLNLSREQFVDLFLISKRWIDAVRLLDPEARYPSFMWDLMSKSGASQIHPHMHVSLGRRRYCGVAERLLKGAHEYYGQTGRNIFADTIAVHESIGLAKRNGDAAMIINLNAMKNYEFIVVGSGMNKYFLDLLYATHKSFFDKYRRYSVSMGCYDRPLTGSSLMPAYCRVVYREYISSVRNDFNGLDLHMSSVLSEDKFAQMSQISPAVDEYLRL